MEARKHERTVELLPPYERNIPESFVVRFTAQSDWRLWETMAFYLGGVGAGLYVVSQFLNSNVGLIAGFMLVVVFKNIAHLLSASRPARALRAFANPKSSWISRGAYFIVLFAISGTLDMGYRFGLFEAGWALGKIASMSALFFAVMIMVYIGLVMAQSRVIPLWHTPLLPVMLLTYSLAMGAGAGFLVQLFGDYEYALDFLGKWFLTTGGLTFLLAIVDGGMMRSSSNAARYSALMLTTGKMAFLYVGGALIAGLLIPLILTAYALVTASFTGIQCFIVGVLILAGGFMFETALLRTGIYTPQVSVE